MKSCLMKAIGSKKGGIIMTYEKFTKKVMSNDSTVTRKDLNIFTRNLMLCFSFLTLDIMVLCAYTVESSLATLLVGVCAIFLFVCLYDYMAEDTKVFNKIKNVSRLWIYVVISSGLFLVISKLLLS